MRLSRPILFCLIVTFGAACNEGQRRTTSSPAASPSPSPEGPAISTAVDATKLPLGDRGFSDIPKNGFVFSCNTNFQERSGAGSAGPWLNESAETWDSTKKITVEGSVQHASQFSAQVEGSNLVISGNGLPNTPTGVFPVTSSDPAYQYDRNPNRINAYTLRAELPANPETKTEPSCVGGTIGVSTLGVPIYSAFDAGGRDAVAWEVQDKCGGHPQMTGQYHFHALPACWEQSEESSSGLVGWAIDGFGIYVEKDANGNLPASADLDECHGRTSSVVWQGKTVSIYHYVASLDFPYLVGCYKGTPITQATGLGIGPPR
jgi:hypothetical protein